MTNAITIAVDKSGAFAAGLNELERRQLPFATMQAVNATAFDVRQRWGEIMPKVFDRPVPLTLKAVLYTKASFAKPVAQIYIRDEAFKGAPPAKYLQAQVEGGQRRHKAFENRLMAAGILPAGMFAVPGKGVALNAFGNLPARQITAVLSQVQAQFDPLNNQTAVSAGRRRRREAKKGQRNGDYFVARRSGHLPAGIYQRITSGFGSSVRSVRSVLFFVKRATYRKRYDIFGAAQKIFDRRFPENLRRELAKAVESAFGRAFK